jgi:hypothetical protein
MEGIDGRWPPIAEKGASTMIVKDIEFYSDWRKTIWHCQEGFIFFPEDAHVLVLRTGRIHSV